MFHGLFSFLSHCCSLFFLFIFGLFALDLSKWDTFHHSFEGVLIESCLQGFVNLSAVYVSQVLHRAALA